MRRLFLPLAISAALMMVASSWTPKPAFAQSKNARQQAAQFFKEGEREYTLGRFETAIEKYQRGFEALPDQWFLYNIAQSYRQLDNCRKALFFYKRYLAFAKRPGSSRKRSEAKEKEVRETLIPDMEEKCKRDKEVREKPPDFVENGGSTTGTTGTGTTTTGTGTTGTGTTGTGTTTNTTGTTGATDVATKDDDDDEFDDDDDDDDDDIGGISALGADQPSLVVTNISIGPSFLGVGAGLDVPARVSFALSAGYPLQLGPASLVAGALINYTPVPWVNGPSSGDAALTSFLANAAGSYEVITNLSVRAELGVGVQLFSGLEAGNPFTLGSAGTSGALGVLNVRVALGAEYAVTPNIAVTLSPVVYSYSPAPTGMRMEMDALTRFEILVGAGYRM